MSISNSYIMSLFPSSGSGSDSLLDAIYGNTGSSSGSQAIAAYQSDLKNETQDVAATAKEPIVEQTIGRFTKDVESATSVNQLLSNPDVLNVLLTVNGLGDQTSFTALAKAALTSDTTNNNSVADQLSNGAWKTAAQAYDFSAKGLSVIQNSSTLAAIAAAYAQTVWEQQQDKANPGLADALAFTQQASSVTSVDGVLGNPVVRTVVQTADNISEYIAEQPLEAQEKAISSQLNVSDLKKSDYVQSMIQRYLINNAANASSSSGTDLTALAVEA